MYVNKNSGFNIDLTQRVTENGMRNGSLLYSSYVNDEENFNLVKNLFILLSDTNPKSGAHILNVTFCEMLEVEMEKYLDKARLLYKKGDYAGIFRELKEEWWNDFKLNSTEINAKVLKVLCLFYKEAERQFISIKSLNTADFPLMYIIALILADTFLSLHIRKKEENLKRKISVNDVKKLKGLRPYELIEVPPRAIFNATVKTLKYEEDYKGMWGCITAYKKGDYTYDEMIEKTPEDLKYVYAFIKEPICPTAANIEKQFNKETFEYIQSIVLNSVTVYSKVVDKLQNLFFAKTLRYLKIEYDKEQEKIKFETNVEMQQLRKDLKIERLRSKELNKKVQMMGIKNAEKVEDVEANRVKIEDLNTRLSEIIQENIKLKETLTEKEEKMQMFTNLTQELAEVEQENVLLKRQKLFDVERYMLVREHRFLFLTEDEEVLNLCKQMYPNSVFFDTIKETSFLPGKIEGIIVFINSVCEEMKAILCNKAKEKNVEIINVEVETQGQIVLATHKMIANK